MSEASGPAIRTFDQELISVFDSFHSKVFGKPLLKKDPPSANIHELIDVECVFNRWNIKFDEKYIQDNIDDGIDIDSGVDVDVEPTIRTGEVQEEEELDNAEEEIAADTSVDSRGIPGWNKWIG